MRKMFNTVLQKKYIIVLLFFCLFYSSCGLFDKDLKQDLHIARFRVQLSRVQDSLNIPVQRIQAFKDIIEYINQDKDLITQRKKNLLLIDANNYISNEYVNIDNFTKALEYSNKSIQLDSTSAKGFFNRGGIYQAMSKDSLALLDYSRATSLNKNYADAYYNRGIIFEKSKKYNEALSDYNRAITERPSYLGDIYNNRGNIYLALEDSVKAMEDYDKVLSIDENNINAYSNRAALYIKKNNIDKAFEDCNKALAIDSTFVRLYIQRAYVFEKKKMYKEAINDYKKAIEFDHGSHDYAKLWDAIERLQSSAGKHHH